MAAADSGGGPSAGRGKISGVTETPSASGPADDSAADSGVPFDPAAYNLGSGVADLPDDIDVLRQEIDRMDAVILAAVKRRSAVSKKIGAARMASGGPRLVHSREVKVLDRFSDLGQEGHTLAMLLLRLGRGPLGR